MSFEALFTRLRRDPKLIYQASKGSEAYLLSFKGIRSLFTRLQGLSKKASKPFNILIKFKPLFQVLVIIYEA